MSSEEIIKKFIKEQYKELSQLQDDMLTADYYCTKSVKKRVEFVKKLLLDAGLSHFKSHEICKKLMMNCLVPAGTKSKVRGDHFNHIIANEISISLKKLKIEGCVFLTEKSHAMFHEIPDWIITNKDKILVGFNQISLFGGGHQVNRGGKYIMDDAIHRKLARENIKMVCVVKDIPIQKHGKSHNILIKGIKTQRLFCIRGLRKLIKDYFVNTK